TAIATRLSATSPFFYDSSGPLRDLHSFPTRRSSDLTDAKGCRRRYCLVGDDVHLHGSIFDVRRHQDGRIETARVKLQRLPASVRSEEHTSELQSRRDLVCRLLLEKKKKHMFKIMLIR